MFNVTVSAGKWDVSGGADGGCGKAGCIPEYRPVRARHLDSVRCVCCSRFVRAMFEEGGTVCVYICFPDLANPDFLSMLPAQCPPRLQDKDDKIPTRGGPESLPYHRRGMTIRCGSLCLKKCGSSTWTFGSETVPISHLVICEYVGTWGGNKQCVPHPVAMLAPWSGPPPRN